MRVVIPTAISVAAYVAIAEELIPALDYLEAAIQKRADELMDVVKTGRTHLQDATPVRLGQRMGAAAHGLVPGVERAARRQLLPRRRPGHRLGR